MRGTHRWLVDSLHEWTVMWKASLCHDIIMNEAASREHSSREMLDAYYGYLNCYLGLLCPDIFTFSPGVTNIYVVNHPLDKDYDTVEKFTWDGKSTVLTHIKSITDPSFHLWVVHNMIDHRKAALPLTISQSLCTPLATALRSPQAHSIQSSVVIMRSNVTWYCILHYSDSGRV